MAYFSCPNEQCRVLIFAATSASKQCPCCWRGGFRLDTATIDELLQALEKTVSGEQLRIPA